MTGVQRYDWSFARLTAPVVTSIILSCPIQSTMEKTFWYRVTQVHLENGCYKTVAAMAAVSECGKRMEFGGGGSCAAT